MKKSRKKNAALILGAFLGLYAVAVPVSASETQDRIAEITEQIDVIEKQIADLKEELKELSGGTYEASSGVDLSGEWKVSNDTFKMVASISDGEISVYWDNGDSKSLYWAGTFENPGSGEEPYTWISQNDTSKTSKSLMASSADTKDFTYENGELSFEASAMGTTSVVRMSRVQ